MRVDPSIAFPVPPGSNATSGTRNHPDERRRWAPLSVAHKADEAVPRDSGAFDARAVTGRGRSGSPGNQNLARSLIHRLFSRTDGGTLKLQGRLIFKSFETVFAPISLRVLDFERFPKSLADTGDV